MGYLYSLAGWSTVLLIFALVVLKYRASIASFLPQQWRARLGLSEYAGHTGSTGSNTLYSRLPTYAWGASRLAGLHSTLFDIEANIRDGDQRSGLEPIGAQEIERLMATDGVDFDTARLMLNRQRFASNNIDPQTGMPLDRKAVTFENLR